MFRIPKPTLASQRFTFAMITAIAALSVFGATQRSHAQAPDEPKPKVTASSDGKITAADLPGFLTNMGYEPEKAGKESWRVVIDRAKFTLRINLSLSGTAAKLWMTSYLVEIPDISRAPKDALIDVLFANDEIGPAHFFFTRVADKERKSHLWLQAGLALDNRGITPRLFRQELDWFCDRLVEKGDLWAAAKWNPALNAGDKPIM